MTPAQLAAQAQTAATQGNTAYNSDINNASTASGQYAGQQANEAQQQQAMQNQTAYMQGAGSGQNVYNNELGTLTSNYGFNPAQLSNANKNLFSLNGALNGANTQFTTPGGVGAYGVSAPSLASYESGVLNPLTTGTSNANTQVTALNNELGTIMGGANNATTAQMTSEQNTVTNLQNTFTAAQTQANQALSQLQYYSTLATTQQGLNATQQQGYETAIQTYQQAQLTLQQISGQAIANQAAINQLPKGTVIAGVTSDGTGATSTGTSGSTTSTKQPTTVVSAGAPSLFSPSNIGNAMGGGTLTQKLSNLITPGVKDVMGWF